MTGFEAFGGDTLNPSWLAAQALGGQHLGGHTVVVACLPVVFATAAHALRGLLQQHRPAMVLCLGVAGERATLSFERIAINVDDARIPDNAGAQPVDEPIVASGPAAYFSNLPIKAMRLAAQAEGVDADISQTAGTFVCNHVFYALLHALATDPVLDGTRGGFAHVPRLPSQGTPCMPLEDMVRGLRAALVCALTTDSDIRQPAGALH